MTLTAIKPTNNKHDGTLDTYHGIDVLRLHVGDPIPTPRAPRRYAVHINPDLARYLLTFNHPNNRQSKPSAIAKYARDITQGFWHFTPEAIIFSLKPQMEDGQNRLYAIIETGAPVWMMIDFGWPEDLIRVINRASSRSNADAFAANAYKSAAVVAASVGVAEKYHLTQGTPKSWTARLLTASESVERYELAPEAWNLAGTWGRRIYDVTRGVGPTTWAAAFFVIAETAGSELAASFFAEMVSGTGAPGSASRRLVSYYTNRRLYDTASGDKREPIENIIRTYNAWRTGKPVGFIRTGGAFVLSMVKAAP